MKISEKMRRVLVLFFEADDKMIGMEVNCPACNNSFTISSPQTSISEVKECPYCGEKILSNAKKCKHCGEFLDESMKQQALQTRTEQKSTPEKVIWEGHASHLYFLGAHILWAILGCLTVIGFLGILYNFLLAKSMKYKLTNKRLSSEKGILSKQTSEVAIEDIRSISLKQGIFERMFGLGTVEVGSAGTAGIEVAFAGISQAPKIKDQITKLKNEI